MIKYKIANILLADSAQAVKNPLLFYRADRSIVFDEDADCNILYGKGTYDLTTYFNAISIEKWHEYTVIDNVYAHVEAKGAPFDIKATSAKRYAQKAEVGSVLASSDAETTEFKTYEFELPVDPNDVIVSFEIETEGKVSLKNCFYYVEVDESQIRDVELALATTTFKKEDYIVPNIEMIKEQIVDSDDPVSSHFHMYVIDNGRTLDVERLSGKSITVCPNPNVGGSGGFARGMIEALEQDPKATHVLLMDDDVVVSPESIKRTYTLLTLVDDDHKDAFISGAMFTIGTSIMQWEDLGNLTVEGRFEPIKPRLLMDKVHDLVYNETYVYPEKTKDRTYAGWWYCCIPTSVIEEYGLPLPLFVRSDDAEYCIRCGQRYITMNGICVWHDCFDEKYSAAVERYQVRRNTLIAQDVTNMAPESDFLLEMNHNLMLELKKLNYKNAELVLEAFEDYLKGPSYISEPVAEQRFMDANRNAEKMIPFDELQLLLDENGIDIDLNSLSESEIDYESKRHFFTKVYDFVTCNGQRSPIKGNPHGVAVVSAEGWVYPAAAIHKKDTLVVIDQFSKKGALRKKDIKRYKDLMSRYKKDLSEYKKNKDKLKAEYSAAKDKLTSIEFWKEYLEKAAN